MVDRLRVFFDGTAARIGRFPDRFVL